MSPSFPPGPTAVRPLTFPSSPPSQTLSPEEQRLFRLYGKLPSQAAVFAKNQQQRKYFDSGDYALNKAGKGDGMDTGTVGDKHPDPENIRHGSINSPVGGGIGAPSAGSPSPVAGGPAGGVVPTAAAAAHLGKTGSISGASTASVGSIPVGSPAKESGLQRETSAEDAVDVDEDDAAASDAAQQGLPIRS